MNIIKQATWQNIVIIYIPRTWFLLLGAEEKKKDEDLLNTLRIAPVWRHKWQTNEEIDF